MTPEFLLVAVAIGTGAAVAFYMAGRHNSVTTDYAFRVIEVVREYDQDEGTMDGSQQLTFEDAINQRNAVLDEVASNNSGWLALAAAEMARLEPGVTGIGEDYKRILLERGVPAPPHPNAVGAFIATMVRRGVLVPTGEYRAMREARSNGRRSPVYSLRHPEAA